MPRKKEVDYEKVRKRKYLRAWRAKNRKRYNTYMREYMQRKREYERYDYDAA